MFIADDTRRIQRMHYTSWGNNNLLIIAVTTNKRNIKHNLTFVKFVE